MTIKEALEEICSKQIPKEVNGISTKYVIKESPNKDVDVFIAPTYIDKNKIAVARKYRYERYKCYHFDDNISSVDNIIGARRNARFYLERDMHEMLCWYIRNIIQYTDNKAVREIRYDKEE